MHLFCQTGAPVFHTLPGNSNSSNSSNSSFYKIFHAYVCTYAGDFSLFFTVPSVTVPYFFLVTGDMVTIELVNIPCVRMRVRTQECFFLFLLSPRHLVIFRSTSGRLQSKNVFAAKIQQTKRSNLTFRSFRSIRSIRSFRR